LDREPEDPEATLEAHLLDAARRGDRDAFAALIDRHYEAVRAFLYRLGVRGGDIDDATQEVFLAVIRSLEDFKQQSRFRTWTFGVGVNVARKFLRRTSATSLVATDESAVDSDPARGIAASEVGEVVRKQLLLLPEPLREAFVLRHVEGLSAVAAAAALGIPEGTLRRHAFEAREQLRARCSALEAMQ
jgi:RNA polymerase sigma-70 factor (ECF subfamily)